MYLAVVVLTMLLLPAASVLLAHVAHPATSLVLLAGRWFVFWGVGVRLGLAGLRQVLQPAFTAREIFRMTSDEALPVIRELGAANLATALVALLSLAAPDVLLPVAISAGMFYGVAGVRHVMHQRRSFNENVAMVSDLFICAVLLAFVALTLAVR